MAAWVCPAGLWQLTNCFRRRLFAQSCPHSGDPLGTRFAGFLGALKRMKINRKWAFRSLRKHFQKHRLNVSLGNFSKALRRFESTRLPARQQDCTPQSLEGEDCGLPTQRQAENLSRWTELRIFPLVFPFCSPRLNFYALKANVGPINNT